MYYTGRHETCTHTSQQLGSTGDRELSEAVTWRYCQAMFQSVEDDWVLNEAETLLDIDGRRERVVADLQSGKIQPVDHAAARDRIERAHPRPAAPGDVGAPTPDLRLR